MERGAAHADANAYRILVALRGASTAIGIVKRGRGISVATVDETRTPARRSDPACRARYDLVFLTRFAYLRRAHQPLWIETIFVGSGGLWYYRDRAAQHRGLHKELAVLLRYVRAAPRSCLGDQPAWLYSAKQGVKRLLGRDRDTFYHLEEGRCSLTRILSSLAS